VLTVTFSGVLKIISGLGMTCGGGRARGKELSKVPRRLGKLNAFSRMLEPPMYLNLHS
jgi:hypothetical protein